MTGGLNWAGSEVYINLADRGKRSSFKALTDHIVTLGLHEARPKTGRGGIGQVVAIDRLLQHDFTHATSRYVSQLIHCVIPLVVSLTN